MSIPFSQYEEAAAYIKNALQKAGCPLPQTGIVLGSGLGRLAQEIDGGWSAPYEEIPGFPRATVASHAGRLYVGALSGRPVVLLAGRFHYYEGYSFETVCFYVRVLRLLGVKTLVLTNAAGGVNPAFTPGDFMLITDHIKLCAESPSRGAIPPELGDRFFDLTAP